MEYFHHEMNELYNNVASTDFDFDRANYQQNMLENMRCQSAPTHEYWI